MSTRVGDCGAVVSTADCTVLRPMATLFLGLTPCLEPEDLAALRSLMAIWLKFFFSAEFFQLQSETLLEHISMASTDSFPLRHRYPEPSLQRVCGRTKFNWPG